MTRKIVFTKYNTIISKVKESDMLVKDSFESSIVEFTEYYHIDCFQDIREKLVQMYRIKYNGIVVGYVTITLAHIRPDATKQIKSKEINNNIPAILISHLAVHKDYQRQGIGTMLIDLVFNLVSNVESIVGCRYIMLKPRDDQGVKDFYKKCGFTYYSDFKDKEYNKENNVKVFLFDLKNNDAHKSNNEIPKIVSS